MKNILKFIFAIQSTILVCACSTSLENNVSKDWSNFDDSCGDTIGYNRNSNVKIPYVYSRYLEDVETRSIGEALTSEEHTHGYLTLRSNPDSREGMYFFVMTEFGVSKISDGTIIELYVDSNQTPKVREFKFAVPETHSLLREIKIGITGSDWKGKKEKPNAYKIVLKTPAGKTITQYKSWLWSLD